MSSTLHMALTSNDFPHVLMSFSSHSIFMRTSVPLVCHPELYSHRVACYTPGWQRCFKAENLELHHSQPCLALPSFPFPSLPSFCMQVCTRAGSEWNCSVEESLGFFSYSVKYFPKKSVSILHHWLGWMMRWFSWFLKFLFRMPVLKTCHSLLYSQYFLSFLKVLAKSKSFNFTSNFANLLKDFLLCAFKICQSVILILFCSHFCMAAAQ